MQVAHHPHSIKFAPIIAAIFPISGGDVTLMSGQTATALAPTAHPLTPEVLPLYTLSLLEVLITASNFNWVDFINAFSPSRLVRTCVDQDVATLECPAVSVGFLPSQYLVWVH